MTTQTLPQEKSRTLEIRIDGRLLPEITPKDIILAVIGTIGTAGGTGSVIEYTGEAIRNLSMVGRMTLRNMSIEAVARAGLISPHYTSFAYLQRREYLSSNWTFAQLTAQM